MIKYNLLKNDSHAKLFFKFFAAKGRKIFFMFLYSCLPVIFFSFIPVSYGVSNVRPAFIFALSFILLFLTSFISYASIIKSFQKSNILSKFIVSGSRKWLIEAIPILSFILLNIIFYSINLGFIIFSISYTKNAMYYSNNFDTPEKIAIFKNAVSVVLWEIDYFTLYFGVILMSLVSLSIVKLYTTKIESKWLKVFYMVIFIILLIIGSGVSFFLPYASVFISSFLTNSVAVKVFSVFKIITYFNPLTHPMTLLNMSIANVVARSNNFLYHVDLNIFVSGVSFWDWTSNYASFANENGETSIEYVFYYKWDKIIALLYSLLFPLLSLYWSSNFLQVYGSLKGIKLFSNKNVADNFMEAKKININNESIDVKNDVPIMGNIIEKIDEKFEKKGAQNE